MDLPIFQLHEEFVCVGNILLSAIARKEVVLAPKTTGS